MGYLSHPKGCETFPCSCIPYTISRTELAQISEIHEMLMVDNVMKMRRLDSGIAIAPDELVRLEPGGSHIMLFDLNKSFQVGETYTVTLDFERAGKMTVPITVKAAVDSAQHHHH